MPTNTGERARPLRLIVVEDEAIVAHELAETIAALGYSVVGVVGTSEAALELVDRVRPDIVLMDIRLGSGRDGIAAAEEIRERYQVAPIFVTAYSDDQTLERAERVSPLGYIVKPFRKQELKATLLSAAAQHRLTQANNESRAWLQGLLSGMSDAVIALDASHRVAFVNPAAEALFQSESAAVLGRRADELHNGGWQDVFTGRTPARFQTRLKSILGAERIVDISAAPVPADASSQPGAVFVLRDITERIIAADLIQRERDFLARRVSTTGAELERTRDELQALTSSLLTAQEDERRRIARDIHDDLAQRAAALEMSAAAISETVGAGNPLAQKQVSDLRGCIRELSDAMRTLSHDLHPAILEDLGLEIALRRYAEEFGRRENISVLFRSARVPRYLPPGMRSGMYRIAQEALRNAAKHSESHVVSIALAQIGRQLRLTVRDHGKGFNPATVRYGQGLGLISMQERSRILRGQIAVLSKPGSGTLVVLRIPVPEPMSLQVRS